MEKKKLSEKKYEEEVIGLLQKIAKQTEPQKPKEESSEAPHGHSTVAEQMLCKDCNPPEEYKKAHLQLMGQQECKDCGHIDRKGKEYCENCGEEYETEE